MESSILRDTFDIFGAMPGDVGECWRASHPGSAGMISGVISGELGMNM